MVNLIKNISADILFMYKHFLHFNISKIVNILVTILYIAVLTIPFIIIINIFSSYVKSTGNISSLYENIYYIIEFVIYFMMISSFVYFFTLQSKVNLEYTKWNKLWLLKNNYLNFKLLLNHFKLMFFYNIIFVLLFLSSSFIFTSFIYLAWWIETASNDLSNIFSISSSILGLITLSLFLYFVYTMLITIVIIVDESKWNEFKSIFYYMKKSFSLSKWFKVKIKLIFITILTFCISLLISIPLSDSVILSGNLKNYIEYNKNPAQFSEENFYYFEWLNTNFWGYTTVELENKLDSSNYKKYLFLVLFLLIVLGLFDMMLVSFYKRELLKGSKSKDNSEKWQSVKKEIKKDIAKKIKVKEIKVKEIKVKEIKAKKEETKKVKTKKSVAKKIPEKKKEVKKDEKKKTIKRSSTKKVEAKKTVTKEVKEKKVPAKKAIKKPTKKAVAKKEKKEPVKKGRGRPKKTDK